MEMGTGLKNNFFYKKCLFLSDSLGLGRGCVMRARLVVVSGKAIAITITMIKEIRQKLRLYKMKI